MAVLSQKAKRNPLIQGDESSHVIEMAILQVSGIFHHLVGCGWYAKHETIGVRSENAVLKKFEALSSVEQKEAAPNAETCNPPLSRM